MAITKQEIADALGVSVTDLEANFAAGFGPAKTRKVQAALDEARTKSQGIITEIRAQMTPILEAISAKQEAHTPIINQLNALIQTIAANPFTQLPDLEALVDQIE
jgi:hypothetical protein